MSSLFNHGVRQSQLLKKDLDQFEVSPGTSPLSIQGQISATLTSFSRTIEDYNQLTQKEIVPEKKEKAEHRVIKFKNELREAKERFQALKLRREEELQATNRSELLGGRGTSTPANPYDLSHTTHRTGYARRNQNSNPEREALFEGRGGNPSLRDSLSRNEGMMRESDFLARTGVQLDEFIERGRLALGDLSEQNDILKRSGVKVMGVLSTLGISRDTIRLVQRRSSEDKLIFWALVITMFVSFYFIYKWFH